MGELGGIGAVGGERSDDISHPHLAGGGGGGGVGGSRGAPRAFMVPPAAISNGNTCKAGDGGSGNGETHLDIKLVVGWY